MTTEEQATALMKKIREWDENHDPIYQDMYDIVLTELKDAQLRGLYKRCKSCAAQIYCMECADAHGRKSYGNWSL